MLARRNIKLKCQHPLFQPLHTTPSCRKLPLKVRFLLPKIARRPRLLRFCIRKAFQRVTDEQPLERLLWGTVPSGDLMEAIILLRCIRCNGCRAQISKGMQSDPAKLQPCSRVAQCALWSFYLINLWWYGRVAFRCSILAVSQRFYG